ncbi:MAG TPA: hypothetical protein VGO56_19770 [Pyrinomonadaceae bacterium]|jgi:hypothetical protein|nr:hypothetical protein [Pyrinomonadaceae bacterium]
MDSGSEKSLIFDALGPMRLREFVAVRIPGRLVWFNFDLARSLGLDVPATNSDNSKLNHQIIDMLSVRALRSGEGLGNREPILLYADKYGGEDLGRCLGAGRAGFLATQNLYLKGIGHTPLFRHDDPDDFEHSHGGVSLLEGMLEAVFGEVNTSLFTKGSARILALIDNDDYTIYPNGKKEPRAIVVRAGAQLRPAHLFAKGVQGGYSKLEVLTRITRLSGQLKTQQDAEPGKPTPDLTQTMLQVIDDHALTAAEQFRWRIMHGAVSMSNMEMSGAMIDSTTESSQPRTAPLRVLTQHPGAYLVFGQEHLERARHLKIMYRSVVKTLSQRERELFNVRPIDFTAEMNRSYGKYLEVQFLKAAGLTTLAAQTLQSTRPDAVHRFQQILSAMAVLKNRGSVNANNPPVEHISVLDIFNLLSAYPRVYFADPGRHHEAEILTLLKPAFKGNRFHQAKQKANVRAMIQQFADAYASVMDTSGAAHHRSIASMRASIVSRAAYQNRPLQALYRGNLLKELARTIEYYKAGGRRTTITKTIAEIISKSHRNLDRP